MKIINPPDIRQHNYHHPPQAWREFHALAALAVDAERFPNLARGWPGFVLIGNRLAYDETNPEACRRAARFNGGCK